MSLILSTIWNVLPIKKEQVGEKDSALTFFKTVYETVFRIAYCLQDLFTMFHFWLEINEAFVSFSNYTSYRQKVTTATTTTATSTTNNNNNNNNNININKNSEEICLLCFQKCIKKKERVRHLPGYCPQTSQETKYAEER